MTNPVSLPYFYCTGGANKSLDRPGRKHANVSVTMAWICLGALPCRERNLMTARVSMLKSHSSLTCFRACFLPGRTQDLSAPRLCMILLCSLTLSNTSYFLTRSVQLISFLHRHRVSKLYRVNATKLFIYSDIWGKSNGKLPPKNLPRMQRARAIPVAWLGSGSCQPGL